MNKTQKSARSQLSQAYDNNQVNTRALTVIIDSIQFLVKQGLALRGSNWDKAANSEDGNFTSLLELMRKYSPQLKSHLENSPRMHGTCRLKSKTN